MAWTGFNQKHIDNYGLEEKELPQCPECGYEMVFNANFGTIEHPVSQWICEQVDCAASPHFTDEGDDENVFEMSPEDKELAMAMIDPLCKHPTSPEPKYVDKSIINVYLTQHSRNKLRALQEAEGMTKQAALREFIKRYLEFTVE